MFFKRTGIWWVVQTALTALMAGMLFVSVPPSRAQADDDAPKQWPLPMAILRYAPSPKLIVVSPDGKKVYYHHGRKFYTLDTESGSIRATGNNDSNDLIVRGNVVVVKFSPDGQYVLLGLDLPYSYSSTFVVRNLKTGKTTTIPNPAKAYAEWVGNKIAVTRMINDTREFNFTRHFNRLTFYSAEGKKIGETKFRGVVLAADTKGTRLVMMANATNATRVTDKHLAGIVVLNVADNKIIRRLRSAKDQHTTIACMSPSGEHVAAGRICSPAEAGEPEVNHLAIFSTMDPDKSLVIRRTRRDYPTAVTDDGKALIIMRSSGSRHGGVLKLMDTNAKSRTLVPRNVIGATVHGKMVYCIIRGEKRSYIRAIPLDLDAALTEDELTSEEPEQPDDKVKDEPEEDDDSQD